MLLRLSVVLFAATALSASEESSRWVRSLQPGAPNVNNKDQPWQVDPNLSRDDNGNTRADVKVKHHGDRHDVEAGWSKVIRGPGKAKPSWHIGGTHRWRRSLQPGAPNVNNKDQPWQVDPNLSRDDRGNTRADVNVKHHGNRHDVEAGWSKVIRGPGKAKPSWHVGGTHRWRRSLQPGAPNVNNKDQPWQVDPNLSRDDRGNTRADVNVKHHGDRHDVEAGWSKVIRGPGKAKPSWHIGGTHRWRRSLQPGAPNINVNNKDQPWQLDPNVSRDDKGNTRTDVNVKHHGDNHDVEAGWSKVIRGPSKAKPTWHVGGTYRWRRSLQPGAPNIDVNNKDQPWQLDPNISRDDQGNTRTDVNIKHHGDDHDVEAGWSKVVRGPERAKPTWHVGGTFRWKRSPEDDISAIAEDEIAEAYEDGEPGTLREKRSSEDEDEDEEEEPWKINPSIGRGDDGNTIADVTLNRHGEDHDIHASWSKVVDGPDRAKPTWHVGGTFKW